MPIARPFAAAATLVASAILTNTTATPGVAQIPKVALSEQHRAMCRVVVGDKLPGLDFATPNGDRQALAPLFGKEATVVAFYRADDAKQLGWMTRTLLADLGPDIAEVFGPRGVAVVLVGTGPATNVTPVKGCLTLVDERGEGLAQIGRGKLPRVYVVDATGKILWFDIEYSNSTRRELRKTLAEVVGDPAQAVAESMRETR